MTDIKNRLLETADQAPGWRNLCTAAHDHIAAQDKRIAELEIALRESEEARGTLKTRTAAVVAEFEAQLAAQAGNPACKGANCGATDGKSHSVECFAEHEACISGGENTAAVPSVNTWYSDITQEELDNLVHPERRNHFAIVQAALESAASRINTICDDWENVGSSQSAIAGRYCASQVSAIKPQPIIDAATKGQQ